MDAIALRALQAPLKERYRQDPNAAVVTFEAHAKLDDDRIACQVDSKAGHVLAGLHPLPPERARRSVPPICCCRRWWRAPA